MRSVRYSSSWYPRRHHFPHAGATYDFGFVCKVILHSKWLCSRVRAILVIDLFAVVDRTFYISVSSCMPSAAEVNILMPSIAIGLTDRSDVPRLSPSMMAAQYAKAGSNPRHRFRFLTVASLRRQAQERIFLLVGR